MLAMGDVALRLLTDDDVTRLYAWEEDVGVGVLSGFVPLRTYEQFLEHARRRLITPNEDLITLGIEHRGHLVGYVQVACIDNEHRRAEIGVVVGEPAARRQGVGTAAVRLACDLAFRRLGLDRLAAQVYGFNRASQAFMERLGFRLEGVLRQHEVHLGERQDMYVYGILRDEFYARYESVYAPDHIPGDTSEG